MSSPDTGGSQCPVERRLAGEVLAITGIGGGQGRLPTESAWVTEINIPLTGGMSAKSGISEH